MTQWIARLLGCRNWTLECVNTHSQDGLEARISHYWRDCGQNGHVVEVFFHPEEGEPPVCIAVVPSTHVQALAALMTESATYLDRVGAKRYARALEED